MGTVSISMLKAKLYDLLVAVSVPYGDRVYLNKAAAETDKAAAETFPSPMGTVSISILKIEFSTLWQGVSVPYGDRVYLNFEN